MNTKLLFCFLGLTILLNLPALAQRDIDDEANTPLKDRIYFGGNFGLQFGSRTFIDVSPLVGYMINSKLSAGVGVTYQYYRFAAQTSANQTTNVSFNVYGGRVFGRYNLSEQLFAYTEFENISVPYFDANYEQSRYWVPAAYVGGGYIQRFGGDRGGIGITALYNVLYNGNSISNSPLTIRFGFFF